ncbi:MAG TPA: hypothetical protein VME43_33265 [Bryobacteraceae bacterium]|nr:hypothetical protein [Bryobacteraceae bacterium]
MAGKASRIVGLLAAVGAIVGLAAAPAWATVCLNGGTTVAACATGWNFNPPTAPAGANNFEVILPGDQTGIVTANYNSFMSPTSSVTYDGTNTTIAFSGSGLAGTGPYGPGLSPVPHFGFTGVVPGATTGGERLPPVTMEWSVGASTTVVPGLGIDFISGNAGVLQFLMVLVDVEPIGGGPATENWFELPYQGSYSLSFLASDGGVQLSDASYFVSPTQIPLDNLNENYYPSNDPQWQPLPNVPNGTTIPSNGSLFAAAMPEPQSLALLVPALLGLGAAVRWRRHSVT